MHRASHVGLILAVLLVGALAAASVARAQATGSSLLVTFAARVCPSYTDITANRARNDIQESLRDLGADTPYSPGEAMNPSVEQENQPACHPLPNWTFTLGTGYRTRAVSGPWGSLSVVTGAFSGPSIITQASTPLLDDQGFPTGQTLQGATTVALTPAQAAIAANPNSLWAQGGSPEDPILNQQFPGEYGFGALRCAIDDLNGDNVEWIGFPSGVRHVFCFAYYVQPPPTSGTIVIRKEVQAPQGTSESFPFTGNISFNQNGGFSLAVKDGQPAQQTFIRAETRPGEPPWDTQEIVPPNWKLTALKCSSQDGQSGSSTDLPTASVSITLAASDTVTCTYTDEFVPPNGGLVIRKLTLGNTGRFSFAVEPKTGGPTVSAVAETHQPDLAVDANPSPLSLAPGAYRLSEKTPESNGGRWSITSADCDGHELDPAQPLQVSVISGTATVCTLTNTFTPSGSITLRKITTGGLATTGFVVSPLSGPPLELHQSARTTHEGVPATASGDPTDDLQLGRYLIQETTSEPAGDGHWELTTVQCDGRDLPFADGQATVTLTASTPHQTCTFTNTHQSKPPPEPPKPPHPTTDPDSRLTITKHAERSEVHLGEPSAYMLTVTNHGPDAAEEVVVDDQPAGPASFHSVTSSQGSCTHSVPARCLIGTIPAGHMVTIELTVIPANTGSFTNRAVVGSSSLDPSYASSVADATVTVTGAHSAPIPSSETSPHFTG